MSGCRSFFCFTVILTIFTWSFCLQVEVGNPNVVWSASEDGTLRQHDFRESTSCPPAGSSRQECRNVLVSTTCWLFSSSSVRIFSFSPNSKNLYFICILWEIFMFYFPPLFILFKWTRVLFVQCYMSRVVASIFFLSFASVFV